MLLFYQRGRRGILAFLTEQSEYYVENKGSAQKTNLKQSGGKQELEVGSQESE
jgi:hypothetical protein